MPLTKRQKRRLLEISKMIESSIVVKDDMEDIQLEYAQEIDGVIEQIQQKLKAKEEPIPPVKSTVPTLSKTAANIRLAREVRKQRKRIREAREYVPPPKPEVEDAPDWAKKLWKAIAKKCHPDRLSFQELNA